jgi:predicted secreted Zn-dependent protease
MLGIAVLAFQVAAYTLPTLDLPSNVSEESQISWYPITGSTLSDLRAQMRLLGPRDGQAVRAGYTHGYTYWHVNFTNDAGNCLMRTVQVTVYDTVTLPLWTPPANADPSVVAEWSRFVTMLGRHEEGHREIMAGGAQQIARTLASLPPHASCPDLLADANAQGHAILTSTQNRQVAYDDETNHGLRHGTKLEDLDSPSPRIPPTLIIVLIAGVAATIVWSLRSRVNKP